MPMLMRLLAIAALLASIGAAPPPVTFTSYADDFDRIAASSAAMAPSQRVATVRARFERLMPGLYRDASDDRIARALAEFPALRPAYRITERRFPAALAAAVTHFRRVFPDFVPPLPIYLVHDLGMRDGGSAYVGGRKVMLFGADMIAQIHNDDSLRPFIEHELFHLEHARHFADCDQLWCSLWQEGLATHAAATMTPGASDHQLLLDIPAGLRRDTDARWADALCHIALHFDSTDQPTIDAAFTGGHRGDPLPARYGYYVGLRVAEAAGSERSLPKLARLDDDAARPVVRAALAGLLSAAHAPCAPPSAAAPITHAAPRPA